MTEKAKNLIREEMLNLPKEVQEAINISNWENISAEIGKEHLLDENEINTLQLETVSFLLGLIDEESYTINIEDSVGISKNEAEKIAEEVDKTIFGPIYDSFAEKIEKSLKLKNPNWKQTFDFIISGGDYSVFIKKENNLDTVFKTPKVDTLDNGSKITNIKNKFVI